MLTLVAARRAFGVASYFVAVAAMARRGVDTAYLAAVEATMAMAYTGGGAAYGSNVSVAGRALRRQHGVLCGGGNGNGVYSCVYVSLL
jgi:hypothetical protein